MIANRLRKTHLLLQKPMQKLLFFSSSKSSSQLSTQLRSDLLQKLQTMKIGTHKSIFMEETEQIITSNQGKDAQTTKKLNKKNKYQFRKLTVQERNQLGVLVPYSAFNIRMTKKCEQSYRKVLCEDLYQAQKQNLPASVRILQLQTTKINIDQYINSTYKDIFARYMISRGLGVEWEAKNSSYGVMNPQPKQQQQPQQISRFFSWLTELIKEYPVSGRQILGLYSYYKKRFIPISGVEVENIYKIGYFFTIKLTKFGRFKESFQVLQERGQQIQLLVMVQDPIKLLNIQAICIQPNKKMVILSKYEQSKSRQGQQTVEQRKIASYLITSMDVYTDHMQNFIQQGYQKHQLFECEHLLEMEAEGIKIVKEIEGYSRKGGAYVIDRYSGLPDFQRINFYQSQMECIYPYQYLGQNGLIRFPQSLHMDSQRDHPIYITDPKYTQKLLEKFQRSNLKARKFKLFTSYQDQIYSYQDQKLHFKIAKKYIIPIPESHYQQLQKALEKSIISESKVVVPKIKPHYPKPRDKRRHKKEIKMLEEQQTEYMSLKQSIESIDQLSFSSIFIQSFSSFPLFICKHYEGGRLAKQQILMNSKIQQLIHQSIILKKIQHSSQIQNGIQVDWDLQKLNQYLSTLSSSTNKQGSNHVKFEIEFINLSQNLYSGFKCFKNYSERPQLSNVVIEPQSKTQNVVPYFFHLHYMIHKKMIKQSMNVQRGRKTRPANKLYTKYTDRLFSLIKFHPTIQQEQRVRTIDQVLFGVLKANSKQQYGYGLEALRIWIARHDSYLGDRKLIDKDVNKQLQLSAFIRKMYWQILPLVNINLNKIFVEDIQLQKMGGDRIQRQKLSYLHNFMLDHINYYILNMQQCYKRLDLNKAIMLTQDFFKNYLQQIFIKPIRRRIISYPLSQKNIQHIYVLKKIIGLIAVISPLLPYSTFHISKTQVLQWPQVKPEDVRVEIIQNYNRMAKLRVQVRNKFILNNFYHSQMVIPPQQINSDFNELADLWRLSKQDLQLFFDIQNISFTEPKEFGKSFHLKLKNDHPIGEVPTIKFYQYRDVCIRCSPMRNYGTHLCERCLDYLNQNFSKKLPLN